MLIMTQLSLPKDIEHFSTIHRIIVDHRSREHFEKFCEKFTRNDFYATLSQGVIDKTDITFLYYLYIDPNDLYEDGRHSFERYLRIYRNNEGLITVRIGTCELFNDQKKELWQETEKYNVKTLDEVCDLLMKRFQKDLNDMTAFFN